MCLAGIKWKTHKINSVNLKKKTLSNTILFLKIFIYPLWGWGLACRKYLFFMLNVGDTLQPESYSICAQVRSKLKK